MSSVLGSELPVQVSSSLSTAEGSVYSVDATHPLGRQPFAEQPHRPSSQTRSNPGRFQLSLNGVYKQLLSNRIFELSNGAELALERVHLEQPTDFSVRHEVVGSVVRMVVRVHQWHGLDRH